MRVVWTHDAWEEYQHWKATDAKVSANIKVLIEDIKRSPFNGLGKPEPLKHALSGWWSRRITQDHRLVYRVSGAGFDLLEIAQCRFHYK